MRIEMISALIVEDNIYMQNHLSGMLSRDGRFEIEALLKDAFEAEGICKNKNIDLVLMDVQTLHNHSGLVAAERIKAISPPTKIIIVTSLIDPDVLAEAKRNGVDSLWYKDHGEKELMEVIEDTLAGNSIFPDSSPSVELNEMFSGDISPRQMAILRRFVMGMTYDEIAKDIGLTKNGVRWNIDQIVEKGGFSNKHELLAALIENKVIVTSLKDR